MSTRPAEITTPYGWAEALDGIRDTRKAITATRTWINARLEHYADLQAGNKTTDTKADTDTDKGTEKGAEPPEASQPPEANEPEKTNEPEKGSEPVNDDEQRRREALDLEELERQQNDLASDGVLDGDYDLEPGDDGAPEPDLEG